MTDLETQLYKALLLLRRGNGTLDEVLNGVFTFRLTESDVAQIETALGAYEDAATIAALSAGDSRALKTAVRLANGGGRER